MSKEKNNKKESGKKQPQKNLKEKRAEKASKREGKDQIDISVFSDKKTNNSK